MFRRAARIAALRLCVVVYSISITRTAARFDCVLDGFFVLLRKKARVSKNGKRAFFTAQEGTRTPTPFRELAPKTSASTYFATCAVIRETLAYLQSRVKPLSASIRAAQLFVLLDFVFKNLDLYARRATFA